ncbi:MAG TPA: M23 family metallopeptidase, partial [Solirubrobacter sp.]|nr:M23 family metallopeptidase [Solirubrobacter sp.]
MALLLAVSLALVAPVAGPVERPFAYGANPFLAGWHRGADFRAAPGAVVRAACAGRVVWAGRDVVTVRCGGYRVTHLPLARVLVARGARVRAGDRLGTLARPSDHAGLHLGVRRANDRFGYIDPVPLLTLPPRGVPAA